MPDAPAAARGVEIPTGDARALPALLAAEVLTVPGVIRLEPTLSTAGPHLLLHRDPADGIRVTARAGVVDVDVNIATAAERQARTVTHQVQARIAALIATHHYTPGVVTVTVLAIEH